MLYRPVSITGPESNLVNFALAESGGNIKSPGNRPIQLKRLVFTISKVRCQIWENIRLMVTISDKGECQILTLHLMFNALYTLNMISREAREACCMMYLFNVKFIPANLNFCNFLQPKPVSNV